MSKYEPCYHKGEKGFMDSDLVLNDIREWLKKTTDSQTLIDTADICLLFGKIENQEKEIERLTKGITEIIQYVNSLKLGSDEATYNKEGYAVDVYDIKKMLAELIGSDKE